MIVLLSRAAVADVVCTLLVSTVSVFPELVVPGVSLRSEGVCSAELLLDFCPPELEFNSYGPFFDADLITVTGLATTVRATTGLLSISLTPALASCAVVMAGTAGASGGVTLRVGVADGEALFPLWILTTAARVLMAC